MENKYSVSQKGIDYWGKVIDASVSDLSSRARLGEDINTLEDINRGVFTDFGRNTSELEDECLDLYVAAAKKFKISIDVMLKALEHEKAHNGAAKMEYGEKTEVAYGLRFSFDGNGVITAVGPTSYHFINENERDHKKDQRIALAPENPSEHDIECARIYSKR